MSVSTEPQKIASVIIDSAGGHYTSFSLDERKEVSGVIIETTNPVQRIRYEASVSDVLELIEYLSLMLADCKEKE